MYVCIDADSVFVLVAVLVVAVTFQAAGKAWSFLSVCQADGELFLQ